MKELTEWSYFELMDRSSVHMHNFETHIAEHPVAEAEPDIKALVEQISELNHALYQQLGALYFTKSK